MADNYPIVAIDTDAKTVDLFIAKGNIVKQSYATATVSPKMGMLWPLEPQKPTKTKVKANATERSGRSPKAVPYTGEMNTSAPAVASEFDGI